MDTMLTPHIAAIILLAVCILLLIIIPLLDGSERFHKFISLRYTLVALSLTMALGCVLDFSHLSDSSRSIVLTGGLSLVGLFVLVRSLEKIKLSNKVINLSAQKGDIKLSANLHNKENSEKSAGKHLICESNSSHEEDCSSEDVECCDPDKDVKNE